MPEREKRCVTCRWWVPEDKDTWGNRSTCHRHPQVVPKAAMSWCGDWEAREEGAGGTL